MNIVEMTHPIAPTRGETSHLHHTQGPSARGCPRLNLSLDRSRSLSHPPLPPGSLPSSRQDERDQGGQAKLASRRIGLPCVPGNDEPLFSAAGLTDQMMPPAGALAAQPALLLACVSPRSDPFAMRGFSLRGGLPWRGLARRPERPRRRPVVDPGDGPPGPRGAGVR